MNGSSLVSGFSSQAGNSINYTTNRFPYMLRIIPIGSDTRITYARRVGSYNIPFQGYEIVAVGVIGSSQNQVNRSVTAVKTLPHLPSIFNFSIFAQSGITQ